MEGFINLFWGETLEGVTIWTVIANTDSFPYWGLFIIFPFSYRLFLFLFFGFFFKYKFIYFNWRLITLQYCVGFAIHQHESATGVHVFPILNPPSSSLPEPSQYTSPILYHASNLDWWFISYMILYKFQCHSPKSSHLLPLPQSPKDCSIHLCLFCCLAYRVMITIFLNSIYMP